MTGSTITRARLPSSPRCAVRSRPTARSIASPIGRPAPSRPRPVASASGPSSITARSESAQRAARAALSVAPPLPSITATSDPSASRSILPPKGAITTRRVPSTWPTGSSRVSPMGIETFRVSSSSSGRLPATITLTRPCSSAVRAGAGSGPSAEERPTSARATSRAPAGRCSGRLASIRVISAASARGTPGTRSARKGGCSKSSLARTAIACCPSNGGLPARHSNSTLPSENTSARRSTPCVPWACSGAMYAGVPTVVPEAVARRSASPRAMPKSITFTRSTTPPGRNRFEGLTSRCTTPSACAAARASATARPSAMVSSVESRPRARRTARSSPSSHSMAIHAMPSAVLPCSTRRTMPAWSSCERILASRSKRTSSRTPWRRSLSATEPPSCRSFAR